MLYNKWHNLDVFSNLSQKSVLSHPWIQHHLYSKCILFQIRWEKMDWKIMIINYQSWIKCNHSCVIYLWIPHTVKCLNVWLEKLWDVDDNWDHNDWNHILAKTFSFSTGLWRIHRLTVIKRIVKSNVMFWKMSKFNLKCILIVINPNQLNFLTNGNGNSHINWSCYCHGQCWIEKVCE